MNKTKHWLLIATLALGASSALKADTVVNVQLLNTPNNHRMEDMLFGVSINNDTYFTTTYYRLKNSGAFEARAMCLKQADYDEWAFKHPREYRKTLNLCFDSLDFRVKDLALPAHATISSDHKLSIDEITQIVSIVVCCQETP